MVKKTPPKKGVENKDAGTQKETGYQGDGPETQGDTTFTKTAAVTLEKKKKKQTFHTSEH